MMDYKKLIYISLCLLIPYSAWSACTGSGTSWSSTPDEGSINTCVSSANSNPGSTLTVSAGSETWTTVKNFTRGVTVVGPGSGSLTITNTSSVSVQYTPDSTARTNNELFEISGFTFNGGSSQIYIDGPNSGALITKVKIHDNVFLGATGMAITGEDHIVGVVYNNTFTNVQYVWGVYGADSQTWVDLSSTAQKYGMDAGQTSWYFEDNTVNWTTNTGEGRVTDGQGTPGIVMRYNTWDYTNRTSRSDPWDFHGLQTMTTAAGFSCPSGCGYANCTPTQDGSCDETIASAQQWAFLKSETYGNILTNSTNADKWADYRGSWNLMFNNRLSGSANPNIYASDRACDEAQSPALGYNQEVNNTYIWNNWVNSTRKDLSVSYDWCGSGSVGKPHTSTENVDWWNYNTSALNGSTEKGINCGSSVPTSDCSEGDGYWKTDFSPCSTPPSTIDDMKTYNQAGVFYTCDDSNTWTEYYTPYTYPHPLRSEAAAPANAIQGVTIGNLQTIEELISWNRSDGLR